MIKNIIVVDEHGKKYGTTYLKRAKGLVKQGRARFLGRNMLCLACPPEHDLEDNNMTDQTIENIVTAKENTEPDGSKYSIDYCLEQIERIGQQTEYLNQAIADLRGMEGDNSCQAKVIALGNMIESREKTNQQMLHFYEKMYDDLKAPVSTDTVSHKARLQEQLLSIIDRTLENGDFSADEVSDMFNGAFDAIRHIND